MDETQAPPVEAAEAPPAAEAPAVEAAPAEAPAAPAAPDLAGEMATLREQIAALTSEKEAAEAAAKEAADAKMSDAERLEQERASFRAEIEDERSRLRTEARSQALQRAGVLPSYHEYVPDLDPRTPDGAKALEKWIASHPETVSRQVESKPSPIENMSNRSSAVAEILTGKRKSTLVTAKSLQKMFNRG